MLGETPYDYNMLYLLLLCLNEGDRKSTTEHAEFPEYYDLERYQEFNCLAVKGF